MKKLLFLSALASTTLGVTAQTPADTMRLNFLNPAHKEVMVAVHRGDWRNYAENCLEGIESAVKMGADIVEIDLWRTADGELVLMHDRTIDRTSTGKGKVADLPLDSIRSVQLRNGVRARTPYRIPTLEEALMANKGRVLFNLDKAFDYFDQVMEILDRTGTTSQIIMKSEAPAREVKEKYGKYLDRVIYMPIVRIDRPGAVEKVKDYLDVLSPAAFEFTYADSTCTTGVELAGLLKGRSRIWYNSLWGSLCGGRDDFASMKHPSDGWGYLIDSLGCSMIQTDQPAPLIKYLKNRRLKDSLREKDRASERARDWAKFGRYAEKNDSLLAAGARPAVVFMGNSITDAWARKRPEFFSDHNFVGRGISGQTTSHMLVRFQADVVDLHPRAVIIHAGINDLAQNNGQISVENIFNNIKSMCQIAKANGIDPIVTSVLPSDAIKWNSSVRVADSVGRLNEMLREYAAKNKLIYVDYFSALDNGTGHMDPSLSADGVHPTLAGYDIMQDVVLKSLKKFCK